MRNLTRHLVCLAVLALFPGLAVRLAAQGASPTPDLPRFTLREIVAGRNDTLTTIPGRWVEAAARATPESLAVRTYRVAATRSGVTPLEGGALASERSRHVMGLYRRAELTGAIQRTLAAIRAALTSDAVRARFDRLFRPRGVWIVDLHDAALAWAQQRVPGTEWEAARRALVAVRWIPNRDTLSAEEVIPRALYGLTVLRANDSAAFDDLRLRLLSSDSTSASAVMLLLTGYAESQEWYVDALRFFLAEPWIPGNEQGRSLADLVRSYWARGRSASAGGEVALPEIRARLFGHPQAVPRYGVPPRLFDRLIRADNPSAQAWLERHGQPGLLQSLRRLPLGDTSLTLLETGSGSFRLTTVPRQARESLNGFLEPGDAIAIDPGYSPILALGTLVHEWQHLVFRQRQLENFSSTLSRVDQPIVELPGVEPYLAEGFAEWSAELVMAPLAERWPILFLGELQKRAGLASGGADDQHAMGYALVRALAAAVPGHVATTDLLLRHAEDPASLVRHRATARAWSRYADKQDRVLALPAHRFLTPEVTFTIEDGYPDVVASRIHVPGNRRRPR